MAALFATTKRDAVWNGFVSRHCAHITHIKVNVTCYIHSNLVCSGTLWFMWTKFQIQEFIRGINFFVLAKLLQVFFPFSCVLSLLFLSSSSSPSPSLFTLLLKVKRISTTVPVAVIPCSTLRLLGRKAATSSSLP